MNIAIQLLTADGVRLENWSIFSFSCFLGVLTIMLLQCASQLPMSFYVFLKRVSFHLSTEYFSIYIIYIIFIYKSHMQVLRYKKDLKFLITSCYHGLIFFFWLVSEISFCVPCISCMILKVVFICY